MASAVQVTDADKFDLLEALYKYGTDVEILHQVLPSWSRSQIEHVIKRFKLSAKRKLQMEEKQTKTACLNQWCQVLENLHQLQGSTNSPWWRKGRARFTEEPRDHTVILSRALKYAALFEDHYVGTSPDDPNYSEIYMYLSQIVLGKEPTQLSPGSAAKILEILGTIKNVMTDECPPGVRHILNLDISYLSKKEEQEQLSENDSQSSRTEEPSPMQTCPLFEEEVEEEEEEKNIVLEPGDPYYEIKRESLAKKIKAKQLEIAQPVLTIPGFNPVEIPPELLLKPTSTII